MRKVAGWRRRRWRWGVGVKMLSVQPLHATSAGSCEKVGRRDAGKPPPPPDPHLSNQPTHPQRIHSAREGEELGCEGVKKKKRHPIAAAPPPSLSLRVLGFGTKPWQRPTTRTRGIFSPPPVSAAVNQAGQGEAGGPHAMPTPPQPLTHHHHHHQWGGRGGGMRQAKTNRADPRVRMCVHVCRGWRDS